MLAYAAGRPRIADRPSSPNAMLIVLCAHIVVVAAVMSAKMDLPRRILHPPTTVISIPLPPAPSPIPTPTPRAATSPTQTDQRTRVTPTAVIPDLPLNLGAGPEPVPLGGPDASRVPLPPVPLPVSSAARLLTPPSELKPPYPESKLLAGEEAALKLRLTIDDQGRVVAVDPVGRADSVFLSAARRYLMSHWRYKPAIEDGRPVSSSIVITLRFELNG